MVSHFNKIIICRINMKIDFSHDWNDDPLVSTALHGIHAIPLVCEASPGFKSFLDLPLISSKFN